MTEHEHELRELWERVRELEERMLLMATQADVDALTQQVQDIATGIVAVQTTLQTELDNLEQQILNAGVGTQVDLSGLQAAIGQISPAVSALGNLQPNNIPPPTPTPEPTPTAAAAPEPNPAPSGTSGPTQTVYTFAGDPSQVDPGAWPTSGYETAPVDGATPQPLYYFTGDTSQGQTNGAGLSGGQWAAYTGPTQPVPPPSAA